MENSAHTDRLACSAASDLDHKLHWLLRPVCRILFGKYGFFFSVNDQRHTRVCTHIPSRLTHCSRETRKRLIDKQCRPRSEDAFSVSTVCK